MSWMNLVTKEVMREVWSLRELLHQRPELGWQETETMRLVTEHLVRAGLQATTVEGGIYADLIVNPDWPLVGFRADLDALAMDEASELRYASQNPGVMHACGHDGHTAMLLVAMQILAEHRELCRRNIRFLFTQAEEIPPGGEPKLIAAGGAKELSRCYGLHLWTERPTGTFHTLVGNITSHSDRATITLNTDGGHAKDLHRKGSLINADAWLTHSLKVNCTDPFPDQGFVHRTFAISPTKAPNILPATCTFEISLRARTTEIYEQVRAQFGNVIDLFRETFLDVGITVDYRQGHVPTYLSTGPTAIAVQAAREVAAWDQSQFYGNSHVNDQMDQMLGGESFGRFWTEAQVPLSFVMLGAGGRGRVDEVHGFEHHTPKFNPDANALQLGVAYWLALAGRS
ncbi:amidohydrolase [Patescibacteria group bacterium]|nr:amidohydrolase [Patescibacteria group bacterium]